MRTTILGHDVSAPIGIAPVGINKIYHPHGEIPVAKVAGEFGIPYSLSTAGSCPIEGENKPRERQTQPKRPPRARGYSSCICRTTTS